MLFQINQKFVFKLKMCRLNNPHQRELSFFNFRRELRQGCVLSPLLFNSYVNEIATMFQNTDSDPFTLPNGTKLNCLMYADNLIILSKTKTWITKWLR